MSARVSHTTFNCRDAYALSTWWKSVLGYTDIADDPNEPGDEECMIVDPATGHRLLFVDVADLSPADGRVHLDLAPTDRPRDEEVARVLALGASEVADRRNADGSGWMVLADIEGNAFCIVRSAAERGPTGTAPHPAPGRN
jgi:catechol 2,3-dioxygenase-like lactoylglutathione lyase family enzyme